MQQFFDERRMRTTDLGGAGKWQWWSEELDDRGNGVSFPSPPRPLSPYTGFGTKTNHLFFVL